MANYVKATDFASKDALTSGDPLKLIKGTEINTEFNNIQTAIATKADLASPAFTGNPTATTQVFGNNSSRLATTAFVQAALQALYPVGSIYIAVISTNPASLFGFGTWVAFGAGRTIVGVDSGDSLFDAAEKTGGSKNAIVVDHTHTATSTVNDPGHSHVIGIVAADDSGGSQNWDGANGGSNLKSTQSATTGITVSTSITSTGVSGTNANLQPFVAVYMWKRTA